jgi:uncharacterized membrane protein
MSASPENLVAILVMALAAMAAKGGGFIAMRWLGRYRFVNALLDHAPGAVLVSAAVVPLTQGGGAFVVGAVVGGSPPACSAPSAPWRWPAGRALPEDQWEVGSLRRTISSLIKSFRFLRLQSASSSGCGLVVSR